MPDPPALDRLIRDAPDEHQRGKVHDIPAFLLNQVQKDRNGQAREADEEERGQKRHHRTRVSLSRADR